MYSCESVSESLYITLSLYIIGMSTGVKGLSTAATGVVSDEFVDVAYVSKMDKGFNLGVMNFRVT